MKECDVNRAEALNEQLIESFKHDVRSHTNDDCSIAILYNDESSFQGYQNLNFFEKQRILHEESNNRSYRDKDKILTYISEDGKSLSTIRKWYHKKPARINETLKRLECLNLVYEKDKLYLPVIKIASEYHAFLEL